MLQDRSPSRTRTVLLCFTVFDCALYNLCPSQTDHTMHTLQVRKVDLTTFHFKHFSWTINNDSNPISNLELNCLNWKYPLQLWWRSSSSFVDINKLLIYISNKNIKWLNLLQLIIQGATANGKKLNQREVLIPIKKIVFRLLLRRDFSG